MQWSEDEPGDDDDFNAVQTHKFETPLDNGRYVHVFGLNPHGEGYISSVEISKESRKRRNPNKPPNEKQLVNGKQDIMRKT